MLQFRKADMATRVIFEQTPLNRNSSVWIIICCVILIALAWINKYFEMFSSVVILIFLVIWIVDRLPFVLTVVKAKSRHKRVLKSGHWWNGDLRYEIDK